MKLVVAASLGLSSLIANAGAMGPVESNTHAIPYISGEGSYSWNGIQGATVNNIAAIISKNGWGGRLSAGVVYPYTEQFGINFELGGGYYGDIKSDLSQRGVVTRTSLIGYDFLFGGTYHAKLIDIFAEVGVLSENMEYKITRDNALVSPGGLLTGVQYINLSQTQMLPEIRVGGVYDLCHNVALSLAYMHAFGHTVTSNNLSTSTSAPATVVRSGTIEQRNPSIDSILLGLRYNFA